MRKKLLSRQCLGHCSETVACIYLRYHGYRIVARNLQSPFVEVDIVAQRGALLVLCEVKSRRGPGVLRVSKYQWQRLESAAVWLGAEHGLSGTGVRLDLMQIWWSRRYPWLQIKHLLGSEG